MEPWAGQIAIYRSLERVKSAIVNGIRYTGDTRQPRLSSAQRHDFQGKLADECWSIALEELVEQLVVA